MRRHGFRLILLSLILGLLSCSESSQPTTPAANIATTVDAALPGQAQQPAVTATPTILRPTGTNVPPTATATPTLIPTPTANPISFYGDPWAIAQQSAGIPRGASCGLVDWLDFPLNPPDGGGLRGGSDFGVFRSRYGKYHAGEDWGFGGNGSSFGKPVYAIGTGLVTYAQPLGWGRDQGVIIVRHTFSDGSEILSFYGHLDPPSFLVEAGDCITRGQELAAIGRPRSSPHLHFEIRTHLPWTPGPGYWETDPIPEGWLPPSQIVMNSRDQIMPGVRWAQIMPYEGNQFVGTLPNGDILLLEDGALASRNGQTGRLNFHLESDNPLLAATLDQASSLIYLADDDEQVLALTLESVVGIGRQDGATLPLAPLWQTELRYGGEPLLLVGPAGGLLLSAGRTLQYLSADGQALWQATMGGQLLSWLPDGDGLLLATDGVADELWQAGPSGAQQLTDQLTGLLNRN
ncbi:MAG: M23 family metallopeptidase, partial [Anaerolineales bacterium]|nr:M23 family metallopeptidase [Anaerolineales bacterium]